MNALAEIEEAMRVFRKQVNAQRVTKAERPPVPVIETSRRTVIIEEKDIPAYRADRKKFLEERLRHDN